MNIFLFDIETAPNVADVWSLFKTNVGINQIHRNGRMIMWAGKYLKSSKIYTMNEIDHGRETMVQELHKILDEADVIVGHNGDRFDIKWANWEFLRAGLRPPATSKTIDTLKIIRNRFYLPSYKLDYICRELGIGSKTAHEGHSLWMKWEMRQESAKNKMIKYCINDVRLLQRLYYKIRPWIKNHPNIGLYDDNTRPVCPNCSSVKVYKRGKSYTSLGIYQRYCCNACGTPIRGRTLLLESKERCKNLLMQER